MKTQRYRKNYLADIKRDCAATVLALHKKAHAGHIGSSLSCLDILIYLHFFKMHPEDQFLLSKGHAATTLYAVLAKSGRISKSQLDSYHKEATLLAVHPPTNAKLNGITFGTGSLGHGLPLAAGVAFSTKFTGRKFNVYCVLSDGDCNEGSTWEAALFAGHHKLSNLIAIIDNNEIQGFGTTKEVLNLEPLRKKWESFNFDVAVAKNGNDFDSLNDAFLSLDSKNSKKPKCIIAKTTKGNGVSFMENKFEWHYLSMTDEQYKSAKSEMGLIEDA